MNTVTHTSSEPMAKPTTSPANRGRERMKVARKNYEYAIKRSGLDLETISNIKRFKKLPQWVSGESAPTVRQLYDLAQKTNTPFGYFFASEPPPLPDDTGIRDFRIQKRLGYSSEIREIREIISRCEEKQSWYSEYIQKGMGEPLPWVGSFNIQDDALMATSYLNDLVPRPEKIHSCVKMFNTLVEKFESVGVMINVSSITGTDSRRKLYPYWFGSFSLSDQFAPLIFINSSIISSLQIFSIVHQFGHLLLDDTGIDSSNQLESVESVEVWCNSMAGEYLVPETLLLQQIDNNEITSIVIGRLSRYFSVSNLLIIRRLYETGKLSMDSYHDRWNTELNVVQNQIMSSRRRHGGGNFYSIHHKRLGAKYTSAVLDEMQNGNVQIYDSEELLDISDQTLLNFAEQLGYNGLLHRY